MVLSNREKGLIAVLVLLLVLSGVYLGIQKALEVRQAKHNSILRRQAILTEAEVLKAQLAVFSRGSVRKVRAGSLISHVEKLAARISLNDQVQLNLLPQDKDRGVQGVEIKVNNLTLDDMVKLVHALESSPQQLIIDQMELSPAFRAQDLLRLSMRVLARS